MIRLELDSSRLGHLFPAYICIASDGTICSIGPALRRIAGDGLSGRLLAEVVEDAPDIAGAAFAGKPVLLRTLDPSLTLSGSAIALDGCLLLALGILPDRSWPLSQPLQISDFASSDPVVAAIMQAGIQSALLEESKAMAFELATERQRVLDLIGRMSRSSAHMAHEFNNLVSIISLNCDRLLRDLGEDASLAPLVTVIRNTALRAATTTQAAMAFAYSHQDPLPGVASAGTSPSFVPTVRVTGTSLSQAHPLPGGRVLVVDDEPDALEALEELLTDFGYTVTAYVCPAEALARFEAGQFDVLLTDVIMPEVTGFELAGKATRIDPGLSVILMSGYLPDGRDRPPEWRFVQKPLEIADLMKVLAQSCATR